MLKLNKKKWVLYSLLAVLLYLIIGAAFPFARYKEINDEVKDAFVTDTFLGDEQGCDRAMILETNQSAWEERIRLINSAEDRIILTTYDLRDGESTRDLFAILLQKADEGVIVQILADGICGLIRMEGKEVFTAVSAHPNVELKLYNRINILKPWKTQGRMHDKYIMVDDKAYIIGGRNTFDYFLGEYNLDEQSYDREILIYNTEHEKEDSQNSSLFQLEKYFNQMWDSSLCTYYYDDEKLLERPKIKKETIFLHDRYRAMKKTNKMLFAEYNYEANTCPTNKVSLISNPTGIYAKKPIVFYQLAELMKTAKKRVRIHTPYAVCNSYMYETLTEICKTVPDTGIVLNSIANGDNFMASADYIWNKNKILNTGISLYEYNGGTSYHGKSILIDDDISIIGTYNLDLRSTYVDTELMLVVQSKGLAAELEANMEVYEADSSKLTYGMEDRIPQHIVIPEIPIWKRAALRVVGFIMQGIRYLI